MGRRAFGLACAIGILVLTTVSCGGSGTVAPAPPGTGALFTLIEDAPACDVLGYQVEVAALQLTPQGSISGTSVTAFSTANGTFLAPVVNVPSLRDITSILNLSRVTVGTYDRADITVILTTAAGYDPSQTPPVTALNLIQSGSTVLVPIVPPLTIAKNQISILKLDYNLAKSLGQDAQGQLTGDVTHVVSISPVAPTTNNTYGEMDDLTGFVRSVTTTPTPSLGFIGSFILQTFSGTGPALTIDLNSSTQLLGAPALNQLLTASYVEVQGHIDSLGNVVADVVRVEDEEDLSKKQLAYIGPILSVNRDASGNVRSFAMMVSATEPDDSFDVPRFQGANVAISSGTSFSSNIPVNNVSQSVPNVTFPAENFANLPFDASTLAPGQEVAVNGIFTKIPGQPDSISADSIYVRPQTLRGNFASLIASGSDDKTGAFQFTTCQNVFQQAPIVVITNSATQFVNVGGLTSLASVPTLLVKGVVMYEAQATTISGVQVPAGSLVVLANQVHQL